MYRLLNSKLTQGLFPAKKLPIFIAWSITSVLFSLLISSQVNSQIIAEPNGYLQNNKTIRVANVEKRSYEVTEENSECARALLAFLERYMNVDAVTSQWSYGGNTYNYSHFSGRIKDNQKSLLNEAQLTKQSNHKSIADEIRQGIQNLFSSHGVGVIKLMVSGRYKSDGKPCFIMFPCDVGTYCID